MRRHRARGSTVFMALQLAIAGTILVVGVGAFMKLTGVNPLSLSFLEENPPELSWHEEPLGLGAEPVKVVLDAADKEAGLDEVIVRISQKNTPKELVRKKYSLPRVERDTIEFVINPKELGFREGNVEVQVLGFDKSLWSNGSRLSKILEVNFLKPQLAVITPQQNGVVGGVELVFYKVIGKTPDSQGVLSQGNLYRGFEAEGWDASFKDKRNLYVAFFPIPASFNPETDSMQLVARDSLGNAATSPFNYRIRSRRWGSFRLQFSQEAATRLRDVFIGYAQHEQIPMKLGGALASDLKQILKALQTSDEGFISTALSESSSKRLWQGAFVPPVPSTPTNIMGDQRVIQIGDSEIAREASPGVRFPVNKRTPIVAGNTGTVVFIGELGLYGNTVIIDHGFGFSSLYAHLSSVIVQRGNAVNKGQVIGNTGTSGLAQTEEVYFETRMHGVPVSPNEWWDGSWITDHIDNKVSFVKNEVG